MKERKSNKNTFIWNSFDAIQLRSISHIPDIQQLRSLLSKKTNTLSDCSLVILQMHTLTKKGSIQKQIFQSFTDNSAIMTLLYSHCTGSVISLALSPPPSNSQKQISAYASNPTHSLLFFGVRCQSHSVRQRPHQWLTQRNVSKLTLCAQRALHISWNTLHQSS